MSLVLVAAPARLHARLVDAHVTPDRWLRTSCNRCASDRQHRPLGQRRLPSSLLLGSTAHCVGLADRWLAGSANRAGNAPHRTPCRLWPANCCPTAPPPAAACHTAASSSPAGPHQPS